MKIYHLHENYKMLKRRVILIIIFCIFIITSVSFGSMLFYFDPYQHKVLSLLLIGVCFTSMISTFIALIFYFFKKVYYRWDVWVYHIVTSLRQSFFLALLLMGIFMIQILGIPLLIPVMLLICSFLFLELFIQSF